jgi:hypothetical protein
MKRTFIYNGAFFFGFLFLMWSLILFSPRSAFAYSDWDSSGYPVPSLTTSSTSTSASSGCSSACPGGQSCVNGTCQATGSGGSGGSFDNGNSSSGGSFDNGNQSTSPGGNSGGYSADNVVPNPTGLHTFTELLNKIISYLNMIVDPLVVIMVLWGGFQILTAGGDEGKFKTGKQTLTYAVIGAIVVICASGLIFVINEFLGVSG